MASPFPIRIAGAKPASRLLASFSPRRTPAVALPVLGVCLALCGCLPDAVEDSASFAEERTAITSGTSSSVSGVVALLGQQGLCSGTLVADQVVLSAAHCVYSGAPEQVSFAFDLTVGTEPSVSVARVFTPENYDRIARDNDISLVFLAAPAPPEVTRWNLGSKIPVAGELVELLGYGETGDGGGAGVQRSGYAEVSKIDSQRITVVPAPSSTCGGDSGGPMAQPREPGIVVGVASTALSTCDGFARHTRVDAQRQPFLDPLLDSFARSDGAPGSWCVDGGQCASGECWSSEALEFFGYCTALCGSDSDCPDEMVCEAGKCRLTGPSPGGLGSLCTSRNDCVSRRCESSAGEARCTRVCVDDPASELACPTGYACASGEDSLQSFCFPVTDSGCAVVAAPGRGTRSPLWLAALVALAITRRRKRTQR